MDKVCRDCGETKPIAEFFKSPRNAGGYAPRCKPCYMIQQAGYRKKPPREETPPGTKRCWMCKTIKPSADFSANKDFHDGLNRGCRACTNARSATYDLANRESLNAKQLARYYADPLRYADYGLKKRLGLPMGSYDKMLAMTGNTAAYMQYSYARVRSIFAKSGLDESAIRNPQSEIHNVWHLWSSGLV